jgi:acyl-CoA thioester hydrolase
VAAERAVGEPFEYPLRVRYAECDVQGVVFNAHYLAYFDISITELWRAAFGGYQTMLERGGDVVVAEAQLNYLSSARFDDELKLGIAVARLGTTSIHTRHHVWRGLELLVEGSLRHVFVDSETYKKKPIPGWVSDGLAPWIVELD